MTPPKTPQAWLIGTGTDLYNPSLKGVPTITRTPQPVPRRQIKHLFARAMRDKVRLVITEL